MPKFRVEISHYMREFITLDVEAESRDDVIEGKSLLYGLACELPGWQLDGDSGAAEDRVDLLEEGSYESSPDATVRLRDDGSTEILDPGGPPNAQKIREVLEKHSSKCLDNTEEREAVLKEILEVIQ
jgi:hypothetical protein